MISLENILSKKTEEIFKNWAEKLGLKDWGWEEKAYGTMGVTYTFGRKVESDFYPGVLPRIQVYTQYSGKAFRVSPSMCVTVQQFPSCCGMAIMLGFSCANNVPPEIYWEFLQFVIHKDRNPAIGIVSNAPGYDKLPSNKAIAENAQLLQKTKNGNYGTCISTYIIYPDRLKTYLSTDLDNNNGPAPAHLYS